MALGITSTGGLWKVVVIDVAQNNQEQGNSEASNSGARHETESSSRWLTLAALIVAGEAIFGLPFHVTRYFRPTFVEVFDISQTQLGGMGSLYGAVAMVSYILGGGLADRFSARALLTGSLLVTGLSGFYLVTIPTLYPMFGLYAFWGVSTILPFWSALIRATRDWGGETTQGRAFGLLDGGRGLVAALLAMLAVFLFAWLMPNGESNSPEEKRAALQSTILIYTFTCFGAAAMVWYCLPKNSLTDEHSLSPGLRPSDERPSSTLGQLGLVLRMPAVWWQATVIIGAYCAFKGVDYYSQYARDIWGWSEVDSAGLSAYSSWMRPVAAVGAGVLADRWRPSGIVILAFALAGIASGVLVWLSPSESGGALLWCVILLGCVGIFALRGIYFALLEESRVPLAVTGTAVGVVSFIGYTPEIFMPILCGVVIDAWAGEAFGYRLLFGMLLAAALLGVFATLALRQLGRRASQTNESEWWTGNREES